MVVALHEKSRKTTFFLLFRIHLDEVVSHVQ